MKNLKFDNRKYALGAMAIAVVLVYVVRLFSIQVLDNTYSESAASNALYYHTLVPTRGSIYDRNGNLLVGNQPSYDITVVMRNVRQLDTLEFCRVLDITPEFFEKRMADIKNRRQNPGYSPYTTQVFMSQIPFDEVSGFRESLYRFKGFDISQSSFRKYYYEAAAHLLGDMGEVSRSEMESDPYYAQGDFIGKQGIERSYEKELRGEKGVEVLLKDAIGRISGSYMDGQLDHEAVTGKDLQLGLDVELQMLGERLMQGKIGSIVAIEPETGEILCMVSAPSYNPSDLVGRNRSQNYSRLANEWSKPLLNRTVSGTYPPGSTFKTAQALTLLEEGIIDERTLFPCTGGFVFGNLRVGCHSHGSPLSLVPAIATSCNGYFCWAYYRMLGDSRYGTPQKAFTVWKDHMVDMGFGYALGTDVPGEKRGMIPNSQYYDRHYNSRWNGLTTISNAIGQGEITLTPLQIANLGATIANRGFYIAPHAVKSVKGRELDSLYVTRHVVNVDRRHYDLVVKGMRESVLSGTCRAANTPAYDVCGKTGTAENNGKDHSVFMGFAPMENPKIAIAVYVENGGFGAVYGVPIGALMIEQYLTGELGEDSQKKAHEIASKVITYEHKNR